MKKVQNPDVPWRDETTVVSGIVPVPSETPGTEAGPVTAAGRELVAAGLDGSVRDFDDYPIDLTVMVLAIEQEAFAKGYQQAQDDRYDNYDLEDY